MKICILTHTFPRFLNDTAAPFMGELAEGLASRGHQILVLAPFDKDIDWKLKRNYQLITFRYIFPDCLHRLGYSRTMENDRKIGIANLILSPFFYLFAFISLLKLVRKEKVDIISSHWTIPNGFIASLVSLITKIPFTTTIPGSDVYLGSKNSFFHWMIGVAVKRANCVISDSPFYIKQLNSLGFYPSKIRIIRYGVDSKKFWITRRDERLKRTLGMSDTDKVILLVGRLVAKKGFIYVVKAMPEIIKKISETKLVIVGEGDQGEMLKKEVRNLGINSKVIFVGTVSYSNLQKFYNLADVFVAPSVRDEEGNLDASPVTMMIAMMCGCPVIATKYSISKDLVNKNASFLIRGKDSRVIAKTIIYFLRKKVSKEERKKIREIALSNFSVSQCVIKYLNIFDSILRNGGSIK